MTSVLIEVFNVILPIVLCALIGYGFAAARIPFDRKFVGSLVSKVGYPALILSHLSGEHIAFSEFVELFGASLLFVALCGVVAFPFLLVVKLPRRAFLAPMMLNNVGNIGLPVVALAFGDSGLAYALAFLIVVIVGIFTIGLWLPMGSIRFGEILRQPVIYAVPVALVLLATDTRMPGPIGSTVEILGGLAIPLMLLTLGNTLATLKVGDLRLGLGLTVFHTAMVTALAFLIVQVFGLTGTARGTFIILCLMPVSVAVYLGVELYDPDDATAVAGFIMISTLASILVLPLALAFWV